MQRGEGEDFEIIYVTTTGNCDIITAAHMLAMKDQTPGQTHLNWDAEQAEEVRVIPIGIELFAAHSAFPGLFPFQQIESQAA